MHHLTSRQVVPLLQLELSAQGVGLQYAPLWQDEAYDPAGQSVGGSGATSARAVPLHSVTIAASAVLEMRLATVRFMRFPFARRCFDLNAKARASQGSRERSRERCRDASGTNL